MSLIAVVLPSCPWLWEMDTGQDISSSFSLKIFYAQEQLLAELIVEVQGLEERIVSLKKENATLSDNSSSSLG
jgi:hypothetical protein